MNSQKKSLNNILYSLAGEVITIVLGLLLPRLWMVSYGSEVNGLLSSLSQFLVYLGLFEAGVGAATLQALYRPIAQNDWDDVSGVLSATHVYYRKTGLWYFIGLMALSALYPLIVDSSLSYTTIFGAVFFNGISNVVSFYLQGKYVFLLRADGKTYIISILNTIIFVANSLLKILLIYLKTNIVFILAMTFFVECIRIVYILWYVKKYYPRIHLDVSPNHAAISQKNFALVHQISALIFHNTDVLILTLLCDLRIVSVYSLFKMITSQLDKFINIPLNSITFSLGQTYQTDKKAYIHRIDIVESYYSGMAYALYSVALYLLLPFIGLYTSGVNDVNYSDRWLAILFVICSLLDCSRRPMMSAIDFAGHYQQTTRFSICEAAINICVSVVGAYVIGIYGVLLGTVISLAYRTNNIILYSNHKLLRRSALKTYAIYLVNIGGFLLNQQLFWWVFGSIDIDSYLVFVLVGFTATCIAVAVMFSCQTLLFPHSRNAAKQLATRMLQNLREKSHTEEP